MTSRSTRVSTRSVLAVAVVALAGGVAWLVRSKRPQPQAPAAAPPRIGYSRNGNAPTPVSGAGADNGH
ncbi:hypothetical protein ACTD5D_01910 [Nocardia takedensis]|uniref:hypothetical protein n=1 Tax=Nocardia takedensis TaxID=259390 RepID=UPI000592F095|nr:hypothetical protein [Nocardia takedensis]